MYLKKTHKVVDIDTGELICYLPITSGGQLPTYRAMIVPLEEQLQPKEITSVNVRVPSHDEKLKMVENMRRYGGGFVVALSECFIRADASNLKKLCKAFPEYVDTYLNW